MARVPTAYENGFGQVQRRADNTPFQDVDTPIDAFDRGGKAQARVGGVTCKGRDGPAWCRC